MIALNNSRTVLTVGSQEKSKREILVVVANRSRARLFCVGETEEKLFEMDDLVNFDVRLPESELVTDRQGRTVNGSNGRHTALGRSGARRYLSARRFAVQVCGAITTHCTNESVHHPVYLIADPEFLGILRPQLHRILPNIPVHETIKNITRLDAMTIRGYLPNHLWPQRSASVRAV